MAVLLEASSERACKTDDLAGSSGKACLYAASSLLVWGAAMTPAEIIGKKCGNRHFACGGRSFYKQC